MAIMFTRRSSSLPWLALAALMSVAASGACSGSDESGGTGGAAAGTGTAGTGGNVGGAPSGGGGTGGAGGACDVNAADSSYSAVSGAVALAADGDTVCVPAGASSWDAALTIDKAITLRAAGIGQTVITNDLVSGSLIEVTEQAAGSVRIEGFDFVVGAGPSPFPDFFIHVGDASGGKPVLVTANQFTLGQSANALGFATNRGVIWNNVFTGSVGGGNCLNNSGALRHKPAGLTDSWTTGPTYGSDDANGDQNLYFESNTATDVLEGVDVDDNARLVFRYNQWTNSALVHHGADTSSIGGRYSEIYGNTFTFDTSTKCAPDLPTNVNAFVFNRGGTMLIHDNTLADITSQAWGDKAEISFIVESIRRNAGPYACWSQGWPAPHQAGWGYASGGTQAGTSGILQDLEPIYLWNNSGGGNYATPNVPDYAPNDCGAGAPSSTDLVQAGREYYTDTPKPGYTAYSYPHPLTLSP
jgi:hypothetical protein